MNCKFFVGVVGILALSACGEETGSKSISETDYCARLVDAQCDRKSACGMDTLQCVQHKMNLIAECEAKVKPLTSAKKAEYNPEAGAACVEATRTMNCNQFYFGLSPKACGGILEGTGALSSMCFANVECASGACSHTVSAGGVCIAGNDVGAFCASPSPKCLDGLVCLQGACSEPLVSGKSCEPSHKTPSDCEAGLFCSEVARVCRGPLAKGDACGASVNAQCAYDLACQGPTGAKACAARIPQGGPCNTAESECILSCYCSNGTCVPKTP